MPPIAPQAPQHGSRLWWSPCGCNCGLPSAEGCPSCIMCGYTMLVPLPMLPAWGCTMPPAPPCPLLIKFVLESSFSSSLTVVDRWLSFRLQCGGGSTHLLNSRPMLWKCGDPNTRKVTIPREAKQLDWMSMTTKSGCVFLTHSTGGMCVNAVRHHLDTMHCMYSL